MNTLHVPDEGLIEGLARVVAVDGSQVWLVAEQASACGSCATRSACGAGMAKTAASWRVPRSLGPDQTPLALGERVHIGVDRQALTRASLIAYALPLLVMLMFASLLQESGDALAIVGALLGLLVGAALARVLARRWRNALAPVVLGRAPINADMSCAPPKTLALRGIALPVVHQRSL